MTVLRPNRTCAVSCCRTEVTKAIGTTSLRFAQEHVAAERSATVNF